MPGALIHLAIGIGLGLLTYKLTSKSFLGIAVFFGSLLPDAVKLLLSFLDTFKSSPYTLIKTSSYSFLGVSTGSIATWITLFFASLGLLYLLYDFHVIKKEALKRYKDVVILVLIGVMVHLILDVLVKETYLALLI